MSILRTHLLLILVFFFYLASPTIAFSKNLDIVSDPRIIKISKCVSGGCSGEICTDASNGPINSTCQWKEEYACLPQAKCELQTSGNCGWTLTSEYNQCVIGSVFDVPIQEIVVPNTNNICGEYTENSPIANLSANCNVQEIPNVPTITPTLYMKNEITLSPTVTQQHPSISDSNTTSKVSPILISNKNKNEVKPVYLHTDNTNILKLNNILLTRRQHSTESRSVPGNKYPVLYTRIINHIRNLFAPHAFNYLSFSK